MIVAPVIFVLDQLTKFVIVYNVLFGDRIPVISGYFDLVHFRNTGAAFGFLAGAADSFRVPFFYTVAILAVVFLGFFYRSLKDDERLMPIAISLVFGGIAGNMTDRIRHGFVVDFLSFHLMDEVLDFSFFGRGYEIVLEWPAFNVADMAITCAMFILVFKMFKFKEA
jgi:signal peptidase II